MTTKEIICKCGCGRKKTVRLADLKRGWGLYYSKSCKAKDQERRTGQYADYLDRQQQAEENERLFGWVDPYETDHPHSTDALGQWLGD